MKSRCYSELIKLETFEERFNYLKLDGLVGETTFGFDRIFNQRFYKSEEWKQTRDKIIIRDNGCDLGCIGHDIYKSIYVHHMNPIMLDDIKNISEYLLNPEYLICVSLSTHNAIHYGDYESIAQNVIERKPNDTCPWKGVKNEQK